MRGSVKAVVLAGALMMAGLGAAVPAAAAVAPPTLDASDFACGHGVCEVGPGNVGVPFAAGLFGTGGPAYAGPECNPFLMRVASGKLPPGLRLGEPICTWLITGTPAKAGRYAFTVKITPQPNSAGQPGGPSGTQKLTITVGTGRSDRIVLSSATWRPGLDPPILQISGFDANSGATYTVTATSTGKRIGRFTGTSPDGSLFQNLGVPPGTFPSQTSPGSITVTDNLGGSATIPVKVNHHD